MVLFSKSVKKNKTTNVITMVNGPSLDVIKSGSSGWSDNGKWLFAATAEIALEHGHKDMAIVWAMYNKCPSDCPLKYCSSDKCYKLDTQQSKLVVEVDSKPKTKKTSAKKPKQKKTRKIKKESD